MFFIEWEYWNYIPSARSAINFLIVSAVCLSWIPILISKGWQTYSENASIMTAISAGRSAITYTHEYRKAGSLPQNSLRGPKESKKYAYSAPDRGTTVPNSAKASAPETKLLFKKCTKWFRTYNFHFLELTRGFVPSYSITTASWMFLEGHSMYVRAQSTGEKQRIVNVFLLKSLYSALIDCGIFLHSEWRSWLVIK